MKNKILFLIIAAVGALLITASNGFSYDELGADVNSACAPVVPYTGNNCGLCHSGSKSDPTDAKDAYSAGGTTLTDFFCPADPTPACTDIDGDTYFINGGECGQVDCDDTDANVNPSASEICDDFTDNDCDGQTDCDDKACIGDANYCDCTDYTNRGSCKADSRCSWSGKNKDCFEPQFYTSEQCETLGGRWNKKKRTCTIR